MKTTKIISGALLLSALVLSTSCQKKSLENPNATANTSSADGFNKVTVNSTTLSGVALVAGQTINSGSVFFDDIDTNNDNVDDAVVVTYSTTDGWELTSVQFAIGNGVTSIPVNKSGNPVPGQFPINTSFTSAVNSYSFLISFATLSITCPSTLSPLYYVAALMLTFAN